MTNTSCCEYSIKSPDDGHYVCPKHTEWYIKIKLRNTATCWLLLYEYIKIHCPNNVKFILHSVHNQSSRQHCTMRFNTSVLPKCSKMSAEKYKICDICRVSVLSQDWSLFYIRRATSRPYCPGHIPFVIYKAFLLVDFSKKKWTSV
jgi:hypothetical protein